MDPRGRIRAGGDEAKRTASGLLPLGPAFPLRGAAGLGAIASVARAAKAKGAMRYRLCFGPLRNLWYAQAALSPVRRSYAPTLARNTVGHESYRRPAAATRKTGRRVARAGAMDLLRAARCRPWSSIYGATHVSNPSISLDNASSELWHASACPWEETRHSGYYSDYPERDAARAYAAKHACVPRGSELERLAGRRIYFVGDSVMRQFSQAALCRLRSSGAVRNDTITWSKILPSPKWGNCLDMSGDTPNRHCFMRDGCVTFEHDVRICFFHNVECKARFALMRLRPWLEQRVAENGPGSQTVLVMTNGMHVACHDRYWKQLNASYKRDVLPHLPLPRSKFKIIYKDLDAQHFPTQSGLYDKEANKSNWRCRETNRSDPNPQQRKLELRMGLPVVRRIGWKILPRFEADRADGALLHATQAPVASRKMPVDCLHWMLPGLPDVWVDRVLRYVASDMGNGDPIAQKEEEAALAKAEAEAERREAQKARVRAASGAGEGG